MLLLIALFYPLDPERDRIMGAVSHPQPTNPFKCQYNFQLSKSELIEFQSKGRLVAKIVM
jgi:hypothetical protein